MNKVYHRPIEDIHAIGYKPVKHYSGNWLISHSEPNRSMRRMRIKPKKPTKPTKVYNGIKSLFWKSDITRRTMAANDLLLTVAVDKNK